MTRARRIRRLAFQALYQIDARGGDEDVLLGDDGEAFDERDRAEALALARAAWERREEADAEFSALAPAWPAHRQAPVDRAILRLAYFEMTSGRVNPKVAVNEAVELAKAFSTEKSPAFVNGLLDKVLRRLRHEAAGAGSEEHA